MSLGPWTGRVVAMGWLLWEGRAWAWVDGEWGGQWKIKVKDGQFSYEPSDDLSDAQAVFHYKHPSDMVLTTYQRIQGGEATGDPEVIDKVNHLFFHI